MKVGVMASGRGSNFQAIIDAELRKETPDVEIVQLIVNNPEAYAIERAKKNNIPYEIIDSSKMTREEFDREAIKIFENKEIQFIVLAGFMRILSPFFINKYKNKILNIHPSLLPSFPGAHAHRDTLKYGAKVSGCTAHIVDEGIDSGPIILQSTVKIDADETEDSLSAKILVHEHKILPKALQLLCSGKIVLDGRNVIMKPD